MEQDPFKEYIKETEPEKRDKGYAWHTAIGSCRWASTIQIPD